MSKKLQKSLQEYLSKIKKQNQNDHRFPTIDSITSSLNHRKLSKMFSGCKHQPKTLSFTIDHNYTLPRHRRKERFVEKEDEEEQGEEATLSDIDKFLVQNFKSLYGKKDDLEESDVESHTSDQILSHGEIKEEKNRLGDYFDKSPQADIFDGAGCSSDSTTSYVNKSLQPAMCTSEKDARVPNECIVVLKRSSSLYEDFWNSMKDLIEARIMENGGAFDGEFLQEMLLCFLHLNEKKYYRYIVGAFVDLTADSKQFADKRST